MTNDEEGPHLMFDNALANISTLQNLRSRSISAENPTGEKGGGGKAAGLLGPGRKGKPCAPVKAGETLVLADIQQSAGVIQHIWMTVAPFRTNECADVLRDLILRMYWDGEEEPSVEVPLGDFFCNGFATRYPVNSAPITVNPVGAMNCYWPMPFGKGAKITLENQHPKDVGAIFYQIDYALMDTLPPATGYFHAQWRRENPTTKGKDYTILDGVKGKGKFVGTFMCVTALEREWWGEGEVKVYLDGDEQLPTICGTGLEDYFCGAWCYREEYGGRSDTSFIEGSTQHIVEQTFCTPYAGYPYYSKRDPNYYQYNREYLLPMHAVYRWHIMDPICFDESIRITAQQIGGQRVRHHHGTGNLFERSDDISSVAYWYQSEPHQKFAPFPRVEDRRPR